MNVEVIQRAVLAALMHVKPDYRSPKRLDDAAQVIAEFVAAELRAEEEKMMRGFSPERNMPFRMSKPPPERPNLEEMLIESQRRYDALTPEQKREMREAQRKSWVIGNFMLDHPEATREEAEEIYRHVVEGVGF